MTPTRRYCLSRNSPLFLPMKIEIDISVISPTKLSTAFAPYENSWSKKRQRGESRMRLLRIWRSVHHEPQNAIVVDLSDKSFNLSVLGLVRIYYYEQPVNLLSQ